MTRTEVCHRLGFLTKSGKPNAPGAIREKMRLDALAIKRRAAFEDRMWVCDEGEYPEFKIDYDLDITDV